VIIIETKKILLRIKELNESTFFKFKAKLSGNSKRD